MRAIYLTIFVLVLSCAPEPKECKCPSHWTDEAPIARLISSDGDPLAIVCGFLSARLTDTSIVASEFLVINCANDSTLLMVGAVQDCWIFESKQSLKFVEFDRWPFGNDWAWIDVPIRQYLITADTAVRMTETLVVQPPMLSQNQIDSLLVEYHRWKTAGTLGDDYETPIGQILALSLIGNQEILNDLPLMHKTLHLDGHSAETYLDAVKIIEAYRDTTIFQGWE